MKFGRPSRIPSEESSRLLKSSLGNFCPDPNGHADQHDEREFGNGAPASHKLFHPRSQIADRNTTELERNRDSIRASKSGRSSIFIVRAI
jgi:hypothetical protein